MFDQMSADPVTNLPHFRRSQLDDSEASLTEAEDFKGAYDIVVHRLIDHADLPAETIFGCVLTIPGTSYRVREESIYRHRGGREFPFYFLQMLTITMQVKFLNNSIATLIAPSRLCLPKVHAYVLK
jgi:hypothetical protein